MEPLKQRVVPDWNCRSSTRERGFTHGSWIVHAWSLKNKYLLQIGLLEPLKQGVVPDWTCKLSTRDSWIVPAWSLKNKELFRIAHAWSLKIAEVVQIRLYYFLKYFDIMLLLLHVERVNVSHHNPLNVDNKAL